MTATESRIRTKVLMMLVDDYGYSSEQIDSEVRIDKTLRADAIVYADEKKRTPLILIEVKASALYSLHTEQLAKYMRLSQARFGMLTDGTSTYCYERVGNEINEISSIPRKGEEETRRLSKSELRAVTDLSYRLQEIYDEIRSGGKLSPSKALNQIQKLVLCKIEDEKSRSTRAMFRLDSEKVKGLKSSRIRRTIDQKMESLFSRVKASYPQLYSKSETLNIEPKTLANAVARLQNYSLLKAPHEDVSVAYTRFVSKNMYMSLGQYFATKQMADFIVGLLDPVEQERVLDPACGAGGFLLSTMHYVLGKTHGQFSAADYAKEKVFGIDIDPDMISICKTNMILHEDGHANIILADFLARLTKTKVVDMAPFDVIVTDPPYGYPIHDRNILDDFVLGSNKKNQQIHVLFIEKCVKMLKPLGRIAIVVPEQFLTSPSMRSARRFVLDNAEVHAIISVPGQAFAPYSGLKTNILILQKKDDPETRRDYDILMVEVIEATADALHGIIRYYRSSLEESTLHGVRVLRIRSSKLGVRWDIAFHRSFELALPKNSLHLGQIAQLRRGTYVPSREYLRQLPLKGIPYIRISDISEGHIRIETAKRVPSGYGKVRTRTGDIILTVRGSIGKTAIVTQSSWGAVPSSQLVLIRPNESLVDLKYLHIMLSSRLVKNQLDFMKVGALISAVPFPELRRLLIPLPNLQHQRRFVRRIAKLERATKSSEKREKVEMEVERFLKGDKS